MNHPLAPPRVSVVLPVHERRDLLRRAIAGVLAQAFADFELLVVDDGSSDDIRGTVAGFGDGRIVYLRRERTGGPAAARNSGIRAARGALIAFQDSDDEWLPGKLADEVQALDRLPAEVCLVCSGYELRRNGSARRIIPAPTLLCEQAVLTHFHFFPSMWLVRRAAIDAAGPFDESLPSREDWDFAIRLLAVGRFAGVSKVHVIKHEGHASVSSNLRSHVSSVDQILSKHRRRFEAQPRALARHLRELGMLQGLFTSPEAARRTFLRAARTAPPGLRALALWAGTLLGQRAMRAVFALKRLWSGGRADV